LHYAPQGLAEGRPPAEEGGAPMRKPNKKWPGEDDILDAWTYLQNGRHNDRKQTVESQNDNGQLSKNEITFGRVCFKWQQYYERNGLGFLELLQELKIPARTALHWIDRYKVHAGLVVPPKKAVRR
jgi:hypothetical protein